MDFLKDSEAAPNMRPTATQQCGRDEKAQIEFHRVAEVTKEGSVLNLDAAVSAYLSALTPPDVAGALESLKGNQRQLDMDGCEVGVSRQALDELIAAYEVSLARPTIDVDRASESLAGMVADWYGNAPLPNARITADIIARRLARFIQPASTITHLAAENALLREREGWKLVPVESTWEMQIAGRDALLDTPDDDSLDLSTDDAGAVYAAMLAASPSHQEQNNG